MNKEKKNRMKIHSTNHFMTYLPITYVSIKRLRMTNMMVMLNSNNMVRHVYMIHVLLMVYIEGF